MSLIKRLLRIRKANSGTPSGSDEGEVDSNRGTLDAFWNYIETEEHRAGDKDGLLRMIVELCTLDKGLLDPQGEAWIREGYELVNTMVETVDDPRITTITGKLQGALKLFRESSLARCVPGSAQFRLMAAIVLWRFWRIIENAKAEPHWESVAFTTALYGALVRTILSWAEAHEVRISVSEWLVDPDHKTFQVNFES